VKCELTRVAIPRSNSIACSDPVNELLIIAWPDRDQFTDVGECDERLSSSHQSYNGGDAAFYAV
jgi:hypothetical protein